MEKQMLLESEKKLDPYLPFILKSTNIARIEDNTVLIGDRRIYPFKKEFVSCHSIEDVALAIETMVTQGGGPLRTAMVAMLFLAGKADRGEIKPTAETFIGAKKRLQITRPTNTTMARILESLVNIICKEIENGYSLELTVQGFIDEFQKEYEKNYFAMADIGSSLINDGDGVLTMCFAETSFLLTIALALEQGKDIKIYSPETRPYLQGARLTAPCLMEIGADVTLITDSMCAHLMSQGKIQKYMTAVDVITSDGWAANKIGTFQNAVTANYHGIPYFPLAIDPDMNRKGRDSIVIEERDPEEVKKIHGVPTTRPDMKAYYPAFDIVPPHLISGVITPKGLISPYGLEYVYNNKEGN
jgi:methylthioribose-1-phosphate isomerase